MANEKSYEKARFSFVPASQKSSTFLVKKKTTKNKVLSLNVVPQQFCSKKLQPFTNKYFGSEFNFDMLKINFILFVVNVSQY